MEREEKIHVITGGMVLITLGVLVILGNTQIWSFSRSWPVLLIVVGANILFKYGRH